MSRLREVQQKLENADALGGIVDGMRTLAAIYLRRAEATLDAIRPYAQNVETALLEVLGRCAECSDPDEESSALVLIFASDQGLCGPYNERIAAAALEFETTHPDLAVTYAAIGHRGHEALALAERTTLLAMESAVSIEGVKAAVDDIGERVYAAILERGIAQCYFAFNRYESVGHYHPVIQKILPPSRETLVTRTHPTLRTPPILTTAPERLLENLIEEFLFIELYRAMLESLASENGARLQAMTFASNNIEDTIEELAQAYRSARQDEITSELLDVVAGAEAVREGRDA